MRTTNKKYESLNLHVGGCKVNWISYFTPTYNRAFLLDRIYENLLNQSDKSFVWIIVNDGSLDNTDTVVHQYISKDEMPIIYVSKQNGGKHSAFEIALKECCTEYFVTMDDDDIYSHESTEYFLSEWNIIKKHSENQQIGAIRTLVKRKNGCYVSHQPKRIDRLFSKCPIICSTLEMQYLKNVSMENWTCYRTSYLKEINIFNKKYWLREYHTFYSEGIWQAKFARKYKCWYTKRVLRTFTTDASVSLTRPIKNKKFYMNWFINLKLSMDEKYYYVLCHPRKFLHDTIWIAILNHNLGYRYVDLYRNTESVFLRLMYLLVYPFSYFIKREINA